MKTKAKIECPARVHHQEETLIRNIFSFYTEKFSDSASNQVLFHTISRRCTRMYVCVNRTVWQCACLRNVCRKDQAKNERNVYFIQTYLTLRYPMHNLITSFQRRIKQKVTNKLEHKKS